jgi:hypothetical protein
MQRPPPPLHLPSSPASYAPQQIASVVFPDAQVLCAPSFAAVCHAPQVKIFLNASSAVRARRRHLELQAAGSPLPYEQVLQDIEARDAADYSRPVGALKKVCELLPRGCGAFAVHCKQALLSLTRRLLASGGGRGGAGQQQHVVPPGGRRGREYHHATRGGLSKAKAASKSTRPFLPTGLKPRQLLQLTVCSLALTAQRRPPLGVRQKIHVAAKRTRQCERGRKAAATKTRAGRGEGMKECG